MRLLEERLNHIQELLRKSKYVLLADMVAIYLAKGKKAESQAIGFVGDDLVGKSTLINFLVGDGLLPTGIMPSLAKVTLKYGETERILTSAGEADRSALDELIEEGDSVEIFAPNDVLKAHSLVMKEFHGLMNKKKLNDLALMSEVYQCDAVVLVLSAEHLLSEPECLFIENYVRYVGPSHLILIINKLSSVDKGDASHLLDYAKKQMERKFSHVKWRIFDGGEKGHLADSRYDSKDMKEEILMMAKIEWEMESNSAKSMLQYIQGELKKEIEPLKEDKKKGLDEIRRKNEKTAQQRELELTSIEEAFIKLKQKGNLAVEQADAFIKRQFDDISRDLLNDFSASLDKYNWYNHELESKWQKAASIASEKTDSFVIEIILRDIEWINETLQVKLGLEPEAFHLPAEKMRRNEELLPYGTYKKYTIIGTGGMVVIGYGLFRMVGAAIGIGGGALAWHYLGVKDNEQMEGVKSELSSKVREISNEVRTISRRELEAIYGKMADEFKREAQRNIEHKYKFTENNTDALDDRINKIQEIITCIEEI